MNNMRDIWEHRLQTYQRETQKYLKYIFTGHLMIVLLFIVGAGGLAYSEWLQVVSPDFPTALVASTVIALTFVTRTPVTLFRHADAIYFLPLEHQLSTYTSRAMRWTMLKQAIAPLVVTLVLLPLFQATLSMSVERLVILLIVLVAWNVLVTLGEWGVRHAYRGRFIYVVYVVHYALSWLLMYSMLVEWSLVTIAIVVAYVTYYYALLMRQMRATPFPFDHFIAVEQSRMMRFYQFANLFTDVPHVQGKVRRRAYASFFMTRAKPFSKEQSYQYLLSRIFVRTDELFRLYVRLFALMIVGAIFIESRTLSLFFLGALQFALISQLIVNLMKEKEFKMDVLFPIPRRERREAVERIVFGLGTVQIFVVTLVALLFRERAMDGLLYLVLFNAIGAMTMFFGRKGNSKDK